MKDILAPLVFLIVIWALVTQPSGCKITIDGVAHEISWSQK